MSRAGDSGKLDGLFILLLASQVFLGLSFVRVIGDAGSAAFGRGVIGAILSYPIVGTKLGAELARFGLTLVLLHAALGVLGFGLARLTRAAWPEGRNSQRVLAIFWFVLLVVWIMGANAAWYPASSLGEPYNGLVRADLAGVSVFTVLTTTLALALAAVLIAAAVRHRALGRSKPVWIGGAACLAAGVALPVIDVISAADGDPADDRPHVIVIGIDSLRTDFVRSSGQTPTPEMDRYLDRAVQFSNTLTPLARTFPSWVSIVSGRHPHTTGAFVNLLPRELIDEGETMPSILSANGYRTVYAIDEVRFSNLDETYGFDDMLAPPMGAADFMLGFFADTPLANVLVNTKVGKWLFPYGYANRAAATTYDPDAFIDRIDDAVEFDRPTLLAVHFTLVHWPYTWATAPRASREEFARLSPIERAHWLYGLAVGRVDEQFGDLMDMLKAKGALDNAIVVVLSDHGESLGEASMIAEHDHVMDQLLGAQEVYGHGTHVFSKDQYNVVLGIRSYGTDVLPPVGGGMIDAPVSLEDVAPTVLDLLGLGRDQRFDGRSLVPYLRSVENAADDNRIRFLETEFNPPGISPDLMMTASAIMTAADKYEIDPDTDRVLVKTRYLEEILSRRQYAAESDGSILATIPAADYRKQHLLYYDAEADSAYWLDSPPTTAASAEISELWTALEQRFAQVRERPVVPPPTWEQETRDERRRESMKVP